MLQCDDNRYHPPDPIGGGGKSVTFSLANG
jgi:hypothetical protein